MGDTGQHEAELAARVDAQATRVRRSREAYEREITRMADLVISDVYRDEREAAAWIDHGGEAGGA
jgi:hypothetical protein